VWPDCFSGNVVTRSSGWTASRCRRLGGCHQWRVHFFHRNPSSRARPTARAYIIRSWGVHSIARLAPTVTPDTGSRNRKLDRPGSYKSFRSYPDCRCPRFHHWRNILAFPVASIPTMARWADPSIQAGAVSSPLTFVATARATIGLLLTPNLHEIGRLNDRDDCFDIVGVRCMRSSRRP